VTAGLIYAHTRRSDLTGIAVNCGDTSDDSLKDQVTVEGFYRLQFEDRVTVGSDLSSGRRRQGQSPI